MNRPTYVVYVMKEQGRDDLVKIGRCSKAGRKRFLENSYMNPRMLDVVAMWAMPSKRESETQEGIAHSLFRRCLTAGGDEWFHASPEEAVQKIADKFKRPPDCTPAGYMPFDVTGLYARGWDDLREGGDIYTPKGSQIQFLAQRRIWIHEEAGGEYRKISHNTWWVDGKGKSSNLKPFTFNTIRTKLVACFAFQVDREALNWHQLVRDANPKTVAVWNEAVDRFGIKDKLTGNAGWTRDDLASIVAFLKERGLVLIPLDQKPRPKGVKSITHKDMSTAIPMTEAA